MTDAEGDFGALPDAAAFQFANIPEDYVIFKRKEK
jgi:hypothetical protein